MEARVREIDIHDLTHDEINPVKRDAKAKKAIRASIDRTGFGRSIVTRNNEIVCGNGVVEEARELGFTKVVEIEVGPDTLVAVKRDDLSDDDAMFMALADNATTKKNRFNEESLQEYIKRGVDMTGVMTEEEMDKIAFGKKKKDEGKVELDESYVSETSGFYLIVECEDQANQEQLFEYLQAEGFQVIKYEGDKRDGKTRKQEGG